MHPFLQSIRDASTRTQLLSITARSPYPNIVEIINSSVGTLNRDDVDDLLFKVFYLASWSREKLYASTNQDKRDIIQLSEKFFIDLLKEMRLHIATTPNFDQLLLRKNNSYSARLIGLEVLANSIRVLIVNQLKDKHDKLTRELPLCKSPSQKLKIEKEINVINNALGSADGDC